MLNCKSSNACCGYTLTGHAIARMKQRSIPEYVLGLLLTHGEQRPVRGNATACFFSREVLSELQEMLGDNFVSFERYAHAYAIVSDDDRCVVTAAYAHHQRRPRSLRSQGRGGRRGPNGRIRGRDVYASHSRMNAQLRIAL